MIVTSLFHQAPQLAKLVICAIFALVKKACIYILFLLIVADNTALDQLLKLPVLFQHYVEHKQRDSKVSLIAFLSMHYWGDDLNDNDNDRDMQLPFKKFDAHPSHLLFFPIMRVVTCKPPFNPITTSAPRYQHNHHLNPALSALFRPPCA